MPLLHGTERLQLEFEQGSRVHDRRQWKAAAVAAIVGGGQA